MIEDEPSQRADPVPVWRLDERAHQIVNATVAFVAVLSPEGEVRDISQNALDAAGIGLGDVVGKKFWGGFWFSHDSDVQDLIRSSIDNGRRGATSHFDYVARIVGDGRLNIDFQLVPITDHQGQVVELIASGFDVTEREYQKSLVEDSLRETNHRIKNLLATVRSMARMTKTFSDRDSAFDDFISRLDALATLHAIFGDGSKLKGAPFEILARKILDVHRRPATSIEIIGDADVIARDQAKLLGLCLHELATNSDKYGALRHGGEIHVSLTAPRDEEQAAFTWEEISFKSVAAGESEGYGLNFIRNTLGHLLGGDTSIKMEGATVRITATGPAPDLFDRVQGE